MKVLHLRRTQINKQPLIFNIAGNILPWIGEVFDNLDMKQDKNYTLKIFEVFNNDKHLSLFDIHKVETPHLLLFIMKRKGIKYALQGLFRKQIISKKLFCSIMDSISNQ